MRKSAPHGRCRAAMLGKHLLGLYEKALDQNDDWRPRLGKAKQLGFDYMEISIDETDERIQRLYWSREQLRELQSASFDLEMPLKSLCLSAHRRFPFGNADRAIRDKAYELMERAIHFSGVMGIRVIQLAGYDTYYEESSPESRKAFLRGMEWSAEIAEKNQVMIAMEIMDTPFLNSITKHLAYEEIIGSPWYKVYPDLGNLSAWDNDVPAELKKGIGSMVGIHLKDTIKDTPESPGVFKCVPFGEGCVDFPACFRLLEDLGYNGPYMMEMWHQQGENDLENAARSKAFIERAFA